MRLPLFAFDEVDLDLLCQPITFIFRHPAAQVRRQPPIGPRGDEVARLVREAQAAHGDVIRLRPDVDLWAALAGNPRTLVLRTSWVFAPAGTNFLRTMLRVGAERPELRVVADQQGSPTAAPS